MSLSWFEPQSRTAEQPHAKAPKAEAPKDEPPRRANDALMHGKHTPDVLQRQIALGIGRSAFTNDYPTWRGTYEDFLNAVTTYKPGPKDGQAFLQGCLYDGTKRGANNMEALHILMLDMETGQPIHEVLAACKASGWCAFIYSTHSHQTTTSTIGLDDWQRWRTANGRTGEPTADDAAEYLRTAKKVLPEILQGVELAGLTEDGKKQIVKHQPMPRSRVCLLLSEPFRITDPAADNQRWKGLVRGVAAKLGFVVDSVAVEIAHLMYTPRHDGSEHARKHQEMHVVAGKMLDLSTITPVDPVDEMAREARAKSKASGAGAAGTEHEVKTRNLRRFLKIAGTSFRAADWLKETDPKNVRNDYGKEGKIDHVCPREDAHTTGDSSDRAFAAWNAKDGKGFGFSCRHAGCTKYVTRPSGKEDRGIYLDLLCEAYGIKDAAELLPYCSAEAQAEWNERPLLFITDHMSSARRFIETCRTVDGVPTLRRWRGEWYAWGGRCYARFSDEAVKGELQRFLDGCDKLNKEKERVPVNPNNELVSNVIAAVKALPGTEVSDNARVPLWLDAQMAPRPAVRDLLACANGLLDLTTREVLPHTASFFSLHCLPMPTIRRPRNPPCSCGAWTNGLVATPRRSGASKSGLP
jgi:hypothetical protein